MEGKKREHRCTWWKKREEKNMCILKRKNDIGVILIPLPGRVSFFYISKTRKVFSIRILHLVCFIISIVVISLLLLSSKSFNSFNLFNLINSFNSSKSSLLEKVRQPSCTCHTRFGGVDALTFWHAYYYLFFTLFLFLFLLIFFRSHLVCSFVVHVASTLFFAFLFW